MKALLFLAVILCFTPGCKKSKDLEIKAKNGKLTVDANWANKDQNFTDAPDFSGTFTGRIISGHVSDVYIDESEIEFNGGIYKSGNFSWSEDKAYRFSFGASNGTFSLKEEKKIQFRNSVLIYHANFNWATILDGEYACKAKGDSLILNKIQLNPDGGPFICQYRLKRVKVK